MHAYFAFAWRNTYSLHQRGSRRQQVFPRYLAVQELRADERQICTGGRCVVDRSRRGMHCREGICQLRSKQVVVRRL